MTSIANRHTGYSVRNNSFVISLLSWCIGGGLAYDNSVVAVRHGVDFWAGRREKEKWQGKQSHAAMFAKIHLMATVLEAISEGKLQHLGSMLGHRITPLDR